VSRLRTPGLGIARSQGESHNNAAQNRNSCPDSLVVWSKVNVKSIERIIETTKEGSAHSNNDQRDSEYAKQSSVHERASNS
jgi:hypothetical protein